MGLLGNGFVTPSLEAQESINANVIQPSQAITAAPIQRNNISVERIQIQNDIQPTTIVKPQPIAPERIHVEPLGVTRIETHSLVPSTTFNFSRGTGGNRSSIAHRENDFQYNRYSRFPGANQIDNKIAQKPRQLRPEQGERVQRVESIVPSLDGYESVKGYSFNPPDFSRDSDWVWLPITSR